MSSDVYRAMTQRTLKVLSDDPGLAMGLYLLVSEIVDDFADWGPVLQANENGDYDDSTAIMKLKKLRDEIMLRRDGRQPA
jgi:hypothetical protein